MSVILNPEIEKLDKDSLCYSLYIQLYNSFFNAQDKKDEDHPVSYTHLTLPTTERV